MTEILVFLGASAALLTVLVFALTWRDDETAAPSGLPSRAVMDRVLAPEDAGFVAGLRDPAVRGLFVRERKRLALAWIGAMQWEARRLLRAHAQAVRNTGDLRPLTELRVGGEFALFVLVCAMLTALIRLLGPYRARSLAGFFDFLVGTLGTLSGRLLVSAGSLDRTVV